MNHFRIDSDRKEFDFVSQEDLLGHEIIKRWKERPNFYRFSICTSHSPYTGTKHTLMADLEEGRKSRIVGFLDNLDGIDLPKWVSVRSK